MKKTIVTGVLALTFALAPASAAWAHYPFANLHGTPAAETGTPSQSKAGCLTDSDQYPPAPGEISDAAQGASESCSGPAGG
jgi:hypothetical protein